MPRVELIHPDLETVIDRWLAERRASWQQLLRGELVAGDVPLDVRSLQLVLVHADPVLWAETFFVEKDADDGAPWRLFDYQKPSLRHRGNTIHECAAEVGKTREVVALGAWLLLGYGPKAKGELLFAASMDGHLDSIYSELDYQLHQTPHLAAAIDWPRSKVKPYRKLVTQSGNLAHYRPAGYDGEAFRGIHAGLAVFGDEVAKWKNPDQYVEFFRAAKPWAEVRLYSTPDGDRKTRFFALCQAAQLAEIHEPAVFEAVAITDPDEALGAPGELAAATAPARARRFVKFRWSKPMMPFPYWSRDRHFEFVEQYGGADSPGYVRNVLGGWGDAADSVFPWEQFEPCARYLPEYVEASLLWDAHAGAVAITAARLNPAFEPKSRVGDEDERAPSMLLTIRDETIPLERLAAELDALLAGLFGACAGPHQVVGVDVGATDDPTEIVVFDVLGERLRCAARLQLKRFKYPDQRRAIRALDRALGAPSYGYGLDATGVGSALEHILVDETEGDAESGDGWSLAGRLSGYVANAERPEVNVETGEPLDDESGKPRRVTQKELGVRALEFRVQRRRIDLPRSPDFMHQFPGYVATIGPSGRRIFTRTGDHLVAAAMVAALRHFDLEHGDGADVAIEATIPRGSERPGFEAPL